MQFSFNLKSIKITRDQKWSFIAVALTVFVLVFTFFWSNNYYQFIQYQNKTIDSLRAIEKELESKKANLNKLLVDYDTFAKGWVLGGSTDRPGTNNAQLIVRALPSVYDPIRFKRLFNNFLLQQSYQGDVDGLPDKLPEDQLEQEIIKIPFSMRVEELNERCNQGTPCVEQLFKDLDALVMPIKVNKITLDKSAGEEMTGLVDVLIDAETYVRPDVKVEIFRTKEIKKEDE